jgi:MATE family multidrug resistance protein
MTSIWGLVVCGLLAIGFAGFGGTIIDIMAKAPEVQLEARAYLGYMVAAPVLGLAAWMLDGVFIGATRSRDMRNMMAVSLAVYVVAALALVPSLGNHGLWLALLISFIARGVTLGLRYPALERDARAG